MPGQNQNPYDAPIVSRPSIADYNGAQKINDPSAAPPNPNTDPTAQEYNEICATLVAMGAVLPLARVSVLVSGPAISKVQSPGLAAVNGNLTAFILTRNSVGNYWVEYSTNTLLPPTGGDPIASIIGIAGAHNYAALAQYGTGPNGHPAVQVTTTEDGALTDLNFVVEIR